VSGNGLFVWEIWRYPVKSMGGEKLDRAELTRSGVAGDRLVQVYSAAGRRVTARTHAGLLRFRARLGDGGEPLVDDRPWSDPRVLAEVSQVAGPGARLVRNEEDDRFDILPLLVATDGAIAAFGRDGRRLRPNIVIGGVRGLAERAWPGAHLRIGDVGIRLDSLRGRCVMTTFHPDTLEQDPGVLKDIVRRFGGQLALNADVVRGGEIRVGQEVELIEGTHREDSARV
jgi:uncharacterized protein YcbX